MTRMIVNFVLIFALSVVTGAQAQTLIRRGAGNSSSGFRQATPAEMAMVSTIVANGMVQQGTAYRPASPEEIRLSQTILQNNGSVPVANYEEESDVREDVVEQEASATSQRNTQIRKPATQVRQRPGDPTPDRFADHRPTLAVQLIAEGWSSWFQGIDKEQFVAYMHEMFSRRFQLVQSYNDPDLRDNMGEVQFANSPWTANATNPKTVGNMQNADYMAVVKIASGSPRTTYGGLNGRQFGVQTMRWSLETRVTIQIVAVNNRSILESGTGSGKASLTAMLNARFGTHSVNGDGGIQQASMYEATRKAAIRAMVDAFKDLKNL